MRASRAFAAFSARSILVRAASTHTPRLVGQPPGVPGPVRPFTGAVIGFLAGFGVASLVGLYMLQREYRSASNSVLASSAQLTDTAMHYLARIQINEERVDELSKLVIPRTLFDSAMENYKRMYTDLFEETLALRERIWHLEHEMLATRSNPSHLSLREDQVVPPRRPTVRVIWPDVLPPDQLPIGASTTFLHVCMSSAEHPIVLDDDESDNGGAKPSAAPQESRQAVPRLADLIPERAQLERERLARAAKRAASELQPETASLSTHATSPRHEEAPQAKRRPHINTRTNSGSAPARAARYQPIQASDHFWHGTIKATFNRYAYPSNPGTTLEQLILPATSAEPNGLERVFLASFDVEIDWLEGLFPDVPITYVGNPPPGNPQTDPRVPPPGFYASSARHNWEMGIPRKPHGRALQHIKLILLFFRTHLRVAVSTGNLSRVDWSRYENAVFVQDFPTTASSTARQLASKRVPKAPGAEFRTQLERVLEALSVPRAHAARSRLGQYAFEGATAHLVASWPVSPVQRGWDAMERAGLARLGRVVRSLGAAPRGLPPLEAQGSSLASYDRRWLETFYLLATGHDARTCLPLATRRGAGADGPSQGFLRCTGHDGWPPVRILFPSQHWVENEAVEGKLGGGCFFGKPDEFARRGQRELYGQPVSHRGNIFMHAKSLLVCEEQATLGENGGDQLDSGATGWVYLGSANFTRAAWGTISGTHDQPTQSISNWELGIVLPLHGVPIEGDPLDAVMYRRPTRRYGEDDSPWDMRTM